MNPRSSRTAVSSRSCVVAATVAVTSLVALTLPRAGRAAGRGRGLPTSVTAPDSSGTVRSVSTAGPIDPNNPFFQSLGTNGRTCGTCHVAQYGWSLTPEQAQSRFAATGGEDPLFHNNDGTNSPNADTSSVDARRAASSMLLSKGLIRVGLPVPANAEFQLVGVDDPYGYASAGELSLFRRPLPSTNLRFLSGVMWDGRESHAGQSLVQNLASQAADATTGHAQADGAPTADQVNQIVQFELGLITAQETDKGAGHLGLASGEGGAANLSHQAFFIGINDPLGGNPNGTMFDPSAFSLFRTWNGRPGKGLLLGTKAAIARGEALFNTHPIHITGVAGLNDDLHQPLVNGTCTTCHDTPNVGNHSVSAPLNIGLVDASRRTADLPLYTLQNKTTRQIVQVTDPGRAMITGKWKDVGRFKGPILRGLASRAPYFHNGSAATLADAVNFYDTRFSIGFTAQERADLIAFLKAL